LKKFILKVIIFVVTSLLRPFSSGCVSVQSTFLPKAMVAKEELPLLLFHGGADRAE